jgi:hypothetical protein
MNLQSPYRRLIGTYLWNSLPAKTRNDNCKTRRSENWYSTGTKILIPTPTPDALSTPILLRIWIR